MMNEIELSSRAVPLSMLNSGNCLTRATGCLLAFESEIYLATNWHILAGRKTDDFQPMDEIAGRLPEQVSFLVTVGAGNSTADMLNMSQYTLIADLLDRSGRPLWLQHPHHGPKVDVAMLAITDLIAKVVADGTPDLTDIPIVDRNSAAGRAILLGDNLTILGFPIAPTRTDNLPVWKRASVATDPGLEVDGLPMFLVDTATRSGMSGSPVFFIEEFVKIQDQNGHLRRNQIASFLGIYSGRYVGEMGEAQLGKIWKAAIPKEIVDQPARGVIEFSQLIMEWGKPND